MIRHLTYLLVMLLLLPALSCAMPVCNKSVQSIEFSLIPRCVDHDHPDKEYKHDSAQMMELGQCTQLVFHQAPVLYQLNPERQPNQFDDGGPSSVYPVSETPVSQLKIRGSPPLNIALLPYPTTYLVTRRLRI